MPPTPSPKRAVVLLSGGLDSAVTALAASSLGYELNGLTFVYGQRHAVETGFATGLAEAIGLVSHRLVTLTGLEDGGSALTDPAVEVPKDRGDADRDHPPNQSHPVRDHVNRSHALDDGPIPVTYVPARNTVFLAYALARCEQLDCADIFLGVNSLDYSGYPDCRPEYLRAFERLAALATRAAVEDGTAIRIRAPLLHRTKADIIRLGASLGLDFAKTWSCYDPVAFPADDGSERPRACGRCDSCHLRRRGFEEAGVADPTPYAGESGGSGE